MAAKFGAKIVPFGVVGEDDIGHVILNAISFTPLVFALQPKNVDTLTSCLSFSSVTVRLQ